MTIKALIVDDEPHAIEIIEAYLKNFSEVEVVGTCGDGISTFKTLQQKHVDLIFLDIKMPGINGTDLLKSLKNPPKVIFTTAYSEYAVEGFELDAVDYLVKPISFDRFLRAMEKILKNFGFGQQIEIAPVPSISEKSSFLYLKVDRRMVKVDTSDILWIESQKDYIKVVLPHKELITKNKISLIEELLPENQFIRIHRSFIVSVAKVDSYYSYAVEVNGKEIPIGRNYKIEAQRRFKVLF